MGLRDPDPDLVRETIDERRRRPRRCHGCDDLPGHCPGARACPLWDSDDLIRGAGADG